MTNQIEPDRDNVLVALDIANKSHDALIETVVDSSRHIKSNVPA